MFLKNKIYVNRLILQRYKVIFQVNCEGADFEQIPILWQTIRALHIKNSSLLVIQKSAFKRYFK